MTTFKFTDGSLKSTTGKISAENHFCSYQPEFMGEKDVYFMSEGFLSFPEKKLHFKDTSYDLSVTFIVCADKPDMTLLYGTAIPLCVYLKHNNEGKLVLSAEITVEEKARGLMTDCPILENIWYTLDLVILDGECCLFLNKSLIGRRVFAGTPVCPPIPEGSMLLLGKPKNSSSSFFNGCISEISFSDQVPDEYRAQANNMASVGWGEAESKQDDLMLELKSTGDLISAHNKLDEDSTCYYNVYQEGVIFWSHDYKAVWISQQIFDTYLELLQSTAVGLPMNDEWIITDGVVSFGTWCMFDVLAIFRDNDGTIRIVQGEIYNEYIRAGGPVGDYGYPVSAEDTITSPEGPDIRYQKFNEYTIFLNEAADGVIVSSALKNRLAQEYLLHVDEYGYIQEVINGYNKKQPDLSSNKVTCIEVCYLKCSKKTLCHYYTYIDSPQDGDIHKASVFYGIENEFFDYLIQHDGINEQADFGDYKHPIGNAEYTASGTLYQNYVGGIIVKYRDGTICGFPQLIITLSNVTCGPIDDWPNRAAELYIEVTLKKNDEVLVDGRRWPEYSYSKHKGASLDILYEGDSVEELKYKIENYEDYRDKNVFYVVENLKASDIITLTVKVFDFDAGYNDYLGTFTIPLDIETGWGYVKDGIPQTSKDGCIINGEAEQRAYERIYLSSEGDDNRNGLSNIRFTFRIGVKDIPFSPDVYFRKTAYWTQDNYKAKDSLPHRIYDTTFGKSTGEWYDWIIRFTDCIWYEIVADCFGGEDGQCFGLSLEAMHAIHGRSVYSLPLAGWDFYTSAKKSTYSGKLDHLGQKVKYIMTSEDTDVDKGFAERIRMMHLYQADWSHLKMVVDKAYRGTLFFPHKEIEQIKKIIDRDKYCIVNFFGPGGHTVLAYKYGVVNDEERIFVANSNYPWWTSDYTDNGSNPDASYFTRKLTIGDGTIEKAVLHNQYDYFDVANKDKTGQNAPKRKTGSNEVSYDIVYGSPYEMFTKSPHAPSLLEICWFVFDSLFKLGFFVINNIGSLISMASTGDSKTTSFSINDVIQEVINLPLSSSISLDEETSEKAYIDVARGLNVRKATTRLVGLRDGASHLYFIGRNRICSIAIPVKKNEVIEVCIDQWNSPKPSVTAMKINGNGDTGNRLEMPIPDYTFGTFGSSVTDKGTDFTDHYTNSNTPVVAEDISDKVTVKMTVPQVKYGKHATFDTFSKPYKKTLPHYVVSKRSQRTGEHEIHMEDCYFLPNPENYVYLGAFATPEEALTVAKTIYKKVDGCCKCCRKIHSI